MGRAHQIASQLRAAGIKVKKVYEPTQECDGEITLSKTISIQLDDHTQFLVESGDGMVGVFHRDQSITQIIATLKKGA